MKKPFLLNGGAVGVIILFSWIYLPSLSKYHDLKLQQEELDKQIEKVTRNVEITREEHGLLKNDPEYLEKVIRDEMGLVKPGEIVYKFVQDPGPSASPSVLPSPFAPPAPLPSVTPSPSPSGITVEARPVPAPSPKPSKKPAPRKPASSTAPVYPRRETR